jgi:hypothetical protein
MPQKKHKPEEIVAKLRQVDVLLSQGRSVGEAVRSIGVTQFTYKALTFLNKISGRCWFRRRSRWRCFLCSEYCGSEGAECIGRVASAPS